MVLHPVLQGYGDERGHVDAVSHGEVFIGLQGAYEEQDERLVAHQLAEDTQASFYLLAPRGINLT